MYIYNYHVNSSLIFVAASQFCTVRIKNNTRTSWRQVHCENMIVRTSETFIYRTRAIALTITISDPCKHKQDGFQYANAQNCRAFWECYHGVSTGNCCPDGHVFTGNYGCTWSETCNATCTDKPRNVGTWSS